MGKHACESGNLSERVPFFGAGLVTQITQLGYRNRQQCQKVFFPHKMLNKMIIETGKHEQGYLYHNILNKMVPKRVIFKVCHSKRGIIFQIRDHSF